MHTQRLPEIATVSRKEIVRARVRRNSLFNFMSSHCLTQSSSDTPSRARFDGAQPIAEADLCKALYCRGSSLASATAAP